MKIWKKTLFTSSDDAKSFLLDHIDRQGVELCSVTCLNSDGFFLSSRFRTGSSVDYLMRFTMNSLGTLTFLEVHKSFRGQKLSLLMIKAGLAYAYEKGIHTINIQNVSWNGPSFWPCLGAVPSKKPFPDIAGYIEDNYISRPRPMDTKSFSDLSAIVQLFKKDHAAGWYRLSNSKARLDDGSVIKEDVFRSLCYADNMTLRLREPRTRALIYHHIGPFRAAL